MCDYSLHHVASRPAKVSDKLVTTELARSSARGFAAVGEHGAKLVIHDSPPKVAVCLLPGTELAFDEDVRYDRAFSLFGKPRVNHKVARFRQIDMDDPHVQHDALEFPDGQVLKVTQLVAGQTATVLLWQTFRSTAIRFSIGLAQSFRRFKARKQRPILGAALPAGVDASFKTDALTVTLPEKKPEKKIEFNAAA